MDIQEDVNEEEVLNAATAELDLNKASKRLRKDTKAQNTKPLRKTPKATNVSDTALVTSLSDDSSFYDEETPRMKIIAKKAMTAAELKVPKDAPKKAGH